MTLGSVLCYPLTNTRFFVSNVEVKIKDTGKIGKLFLKVEKKTFCIQHVRRGPDRIGLLGKPPS
jgi:hypothetical protein